MGCTTAGRAARAARSLAGMARAARSRAPAAASRGEGVLGAAAGPAAGTACEVRGTGRQRTPRSEEHTSELQSLMRISYAVFCLKKKSRHILRLEQLR